MKNSYFLFLLIIISISCTESSKQSPPINLTCEYLINPLGIDTPHPRLRWQMNDSRNGAYQQAYSIIVGKDSIKVAKGKGKEWNSKKVIGDHMLVPYQGTSLKPFTKYYWTVKLWDENNVESSYAQVSSFETGLMDQKNWKGYFITDLEDIDLKPAPYFRNEFNISGKIKKARAYITSAGLHELYINGEKVGDQLLNPTYTRFDKRLLYVTHDITKALQNKENTVGILLGNGWYNHQSTAVWEFHKAEWRNRPSVCLNLHITYEDGKTEIISTDKSWKTALSPLIFNSIYTAAHYDARKEIKNWNLPGFDDSNWKNVVEVKNPTSKIVAQTLQPVRITEKIHPASFNKFSDTNYVYDLGTNFAGTSRIKVKGPKGTIIKLIHSEVLGSDQHVDLTNIEVHYRPTDDSDPFQTDIFILKGEGEEVFQPKFNYKGFQFVEVKSDQPIQLTKESLTGLRMHSDVPVVGNITSSDTLINKIWEATNNSYLSNLFGYPTDCPQREKNGWTGDAHIAIETGLYNFDGITIYEKWLEDHKDEQQPNGIFPAIIPTNGWGYQWANGPDWTSTIAIIPWNIYLFYGDTTILSNSYESLKLYVDHIVEISPNHLTDWGLGDWIPVKDMSAKELTSSIYYYVDALILARAAMILNKENNYEKYLNLSEQIKSAINDKYLDRETGIYGSGFQTELSAPLFWGIVPEEMKEKVAQNLVNKVLEDDKHINVGLLGSKTLLNALSENGYADLAYEITSQDSYPSWGWWIKNGATSLFENWPIDAQSDISRNHIMFGEISAWFYKALGGIKPDPAYPGFKNILLNPHFVEGLEDFEARHLSPFGEIISSWKKEGGNKVIYMVKIPPNSTASLSIRGKEMEVLGNDDKENINITKEGELHLVHLPSGRYEFSISL